MPPPHQPALPPAPLTRLTPRAWASLLLLCGAIFLNTLDLSMVSVALPEIRSALHVPATLLPWLLSSYVLGFAGFLLLGGRAADYFGRRRMFVLSLAVFFTAATLGAITTVPLILIITRFAKGMSAAFTTPAALSIITTTFPEGPARHRALSVAVATGAAGFALGLVAGGLLAQLSWRAVIAAPAVAALAALLAGPVLLSPDRHTHQRPPSFDLPGAVALTAAMLLLVSALSQVPTDGWHSLPTFVRILAAAAAAAAFLTVEHRAKHPLIRLTLFRSSALVQANIGAMALVGAFIGFLFLQTLYLQQVRHWPPLTTGLAFLPTGIIPAALAPAVSPLVARIGATPLAITGLVSSLAAYALALTIGLHTSYQDALLPSTVLAGISFGLADAPLTIAATRGLPASEQGVVTALVNTSAQFGAALVLAFIAAAGSTGYHAAQSAAALQHALHVGAIVPVVAASIGLVAMLIPANRPKQR